MRGMLIFLLLFVVSNMTGQVDGMTGATTKYKNHKKSKSQPTKTKKMNPNHIIYADLSTYSPAETIPFYEKVFGWRFENDYDNYTAYLGNTIVAGLYETPEKFKKINMPHFWMTYIQVNKVDKTVEIAEEMGGIIEAKITIPYYGKMALIRDPQGAGFTIYQGSKLPVSRTENEVDTLIWNELHISNIKKEIPFYEAIFDWKFIKEDDQHYKIHSDGKHISDASYP